MRISPHTDILLAVIDPADIQLPPTEPIDLTELIRERAGS